MRRAGFAAAVSALIVVLALLAWYFHDRATQPGASVLADATLAKLVDGAPKILAVKVEGVEPDGGINPEYTCDGPDRTPRVSVDGIPGTASYVALIMYDPDAPGGTFIHWLAVEPVRGSQAEFPAPGLVEGVNDFGSLGYRGPCPPRGHGVHRYFFLVIALTEDPHLSPGFRLSDLLSTAEGKIAAWGYAVGTYSR